MKKLLLLTFTLLVLALPVKSQFPYASIWSDFSPTYSLTSGFATTITPGFLWCGYQPALAPGGFPWWPNNMNFFIRGVGASGIWPAYKLYEGIRPDCSGPLTQILDGVGVSAIEANGLGAASNSPVRYAIAGAYSGGCYFVGINSAGVPVARNLFPFPLNINPGGPAPSRTHIYQPANSTDFFITGAYEGCVYVLKINNTGNILWSNFYRLPGNATPNDLIVSPHLANELLIVGSTEMSVGNNDGFLMTVDLNTGFNINCKTFNNVFGNDEFKTIIPASAGMPNNGAGYVIGGSSEVAPNQIEAWLLKLDVNANILWSNIMQPTSGANLGFVDIIERINTASIIEYYGVIRSVAGMVVLKLDEWGNPYLFPADALHNEFIYNLPATIPSIPACISQVQGPPNTPDLGFQVYGTASNISSARTSHFVSAYFNGESNCFKTLQLQNTPLKGPVESFAHAIQTYGGFEACPNFSVQVVYPGGAMNFPCSGYISFGSNLKTIPTGVSDVAAIDASAFSVFPNPVKNKATVKFVAQENQSVSIVLKNTIGQIIYTSQFNANASDIFEEEIDFSVLDLQSGVYFISATVNGSTQTQKVVYNK